MAMKAMKKAIKAVAVKGDDEAAAPKKRRAMKAKKA